MSVSPSTLGVYRVERELGRGGMGVVYLARDPRLDRPVAIKVLPDEVALNPDALARFEREARLLASVTHPNVATIYGVEEADGRRLLIMEYIPGETLAERTARGALPLDEALDICRQIALAIEAAHEGGVIHRDLKPGNVKITPNGQVKVLDFGLAKSGSVTSAADVAEAATIHQTAFGAILGTAPYMSPEQARGKLVDTRTDIWSFGCVLFECLTGRQTFEGETASDTIAKILEREPDWAALPAATPPGIRELLRRCLEKDAKRRQRDIGDVRIQLEETIAARSMLRSGVVPRDAAHHGRPRRMTLLLATALVAALLVTAWALWRPRAFEPVERQARPFTSWPGAETDSRVSPDGKWVLFLSTRSGDAEVFVQPIDGTEAKRVSLAAGRPGGCVWSPDGRELACLLDQDGRTVIHVIPAFFGGAQRLTLLIEPTPLAARLLRWIGREVFFQTETQAGRSLHRIGTADGASAVPVSKAWQVTGAVRDFDVHPDGRRVVYSAIDGEQEDLWIANLDGSGATRVTTGAFFERRPLWSGPGKTIIYQSNRGGQIDLWELDPVSGRVWPLTSSQTEETPESTSPDGSIVSFDQSSEEAHLWNWPAAGGSPRPLTSDALSDFTAALSASEDVLAFQRTRPSLSRGFALLDSKIFVTKVDAGRLPAESRGVVDGFAATLSADGTLLAHLQRTGGAPRGTLFVFNLATNETVTLSTSVDLPAFSPFPPDWAYRPAAWNPVRPELYFVEHQNVWTMHRYVPGQIGPGPALVTSAAANEMFRDLHSTNDGQSVAYLRVAPQVTTVELLDLASGSTRSLAKLPSSYTGTAVLGWMGEGLVVVNKTAVHGDLSGDADVLVVSQSGVVRAIGSMSHVFPTTARLDSERRKILVTGVEGGVHNIYSFSIDTGVAKAISDNTLPGVTFSGFAPYGAGLIATRDERKRDIWLSTTRVAGRAQ